MCTGHNSCRGDATVHKNVAPGDESRLRSEQEHRKGKLPRQPSTISAALGGRPIVASSLGLIAKALADAPTVDLIDRLLLADSPGSRLEDRSFGPGYPGDRSPS